MQHTHKSTPFSLKKHTITLICDGVSSPANIGGLLRLGDAFGVAQILFSNAVIDFTSPRLRKAARNSHTNIPHAMVDDIEGCIAEFKSQDYQVIALEISSMSKPIQKMESLDNQKIALVIGNEQHGVSAEALAMVHETAHIEMFGLNSSMNVTQAAAIALFEFTKR